MNKQRKEFWQGIKPKDKKPTEWWVYFLVSLIFIAGFLIIYFTLKN